MTDDAQKLEQASAVLREYCLRVIRFLAGTAMDPHRYFEQKYCGDVAVATSREQLTDILLGLVEWCSEINIADSALTSFDRSLQSDGYPALSMLCAHDSRQAGLILANGRIDSPQDCQLIRDFIRAAPLTDTDRIIAQRRLNEYA